MNILDRVIGAVSPEAGLRRVSARLRTQALMHYDAAEQGRRTWNWKAPATSADAAAYGSRARLRQLSREAIRNRPYAARGRDVVVANVVGEGIRPSVRSSDPEVKAGVEDLLSRHLLSRALDARGECDLYEMQKVAMSSVFSDGEVLLRRRMRNPRFARGLALPYQVEMVEIDCLDTTVQSYGRNEVIEGVEYGPTGTVEAYHIYDRHPGDLRWNTALTTTRVHASDVIHVRRIDRPGQMRGVPWLAPVLLTLSEISDYQENQILKQKMAALLALIVKWPENGRPADFGKGLDHLEPGAVVNLPDGAEATTMEPPTVDGFGEFMDQALRSVAAGIGITFEALSGKLKDVNFSSMRMGRNEMDRMVRMWQRELIRMQFGGGMERWFREGLTLAGHGGLDFKIDWTTPRRILVDPTKEIPSMIREVDAGLNSLQGAQRELGRDPEQIRDERAQDMKADREAGLTEAEAGDA